MFGTKIPKDKVLIDKGEYEELLNLKKEQSSRCK